MILEFFFNLILNISYKRNRFFFIFLEKNLKFISNNKSSPITFYLSFISMLAEFDFILKQYSYKKDIFITCQTSYFKIVFILPTKVKVFSFRKFITKESNFLRLYIFLFLNKKF